MRPKNYTYKEFIKATFEFIFPAILMGVSCLRGYCYCYNHGRRKHLKEFLTWMRKVATRNECTKYQGLINVGGQGERLQGVFEGSH